MIFQSLRTGGCLELGAAAVPARVAQLLGECGSTVGGVLAQGPCWFVRHLAGVWAVPTGGVNVFDTYHGAPKSGRGLYKDHALLTDRRIS